MSATPSETTSSPAFLPVRLADRGVVSVSGPDAASFLHNLVSADIADLAEGAATYAALLTPQGKILFDFIALRHGDGFLLDVLAEQTAALVKRLAMYRLRSQVVLADRSEELAVVAGASAAALQFGEALVFADPRLPTLGFRAIVPKTQVGGIPAETQLYNQLKIELAVPTLGVDYKSGENVPHDVNLDNLNALDFRKGCYVGQEIVSRMKHRGTARRRLVHVRTVDGAAPALPSPHSEILAGSRSIGTMGASSGAAGLAILRLDWVKDAIDHAIPITCDGIELSVTLPAYATFDFPQTVAEA